LVYQKAGAIDVLTTTRGLAYVATVEDMTMKTGGRQFEPHFFGVVRVTQAVLPKMARAALRPHHHDQLRLRTS